MAPTATLTYTQAISNFRCVEISNIDGDFIDQKVTMKDGSNDTVHKWMQWASTVVFP
jgi:hypothetical protein